MTAAEVKALPKLDLHRHLEGSVRTATYIELAKQLGVALPGATEEEIAPLLQVQPGDEKSLTAFLTKFLWLRKVFVNREALARLTFEACEDAALDNVNYLELRLSPLRFFEAGMSERDVAAGLAEGARLAEQRYGIRTGFICGFARDMPLQASERVLRFALDYMDEGIRAVDLLGDEATDPELFEGIFRTAKNAGLFITVHAGEAGGPENIEKSIRLLGAQRIGHGTHIYHNATAAHIAKESGVLIECCLTSNLQTGAAATLEEHPLPRLLQDGIAANLNTDDPGVSGGLLLSGEFALGQSTLGLSDETLLSMQRRALGHIIRPELKSALEKIFAAVTKQ